MNRAFTKYLHAKTTEQASDSVLGNVPSDNQHTPPDTEENVVVTPDDDAKFNEMISCLILQHEPFAHIGSFPLILYSSGYLDNPKGVQFISNPFPNKKCPINNAEKGTKPRALDRCCKHVGQDASYVLISSLHWT